MFGASEIEGRWDKIFSRAVSFVGRRNNTSVKELTAGFQVHAVLDGDEPEGEDTREADHGAAQQGEYPRVVREVSHDLVPGHPFVDGTAEDVAGRRVSGVRAVAGERV